MPMKKCKECKTAMAVVLCNKGGGTTDWWYCEKCLSKAMTEDPLTNIRWRRQGIAEGGPSWPGGIMIWDDVWQMYLPPRGLRGSPQNTERLSCFLAEMKRRATLN